MSEKPLPEWSKEIEVEIQAIKKIQSSHQERLNQIEAQLADLKISRQPEKQYERGGPRLASYAQREFIWQLNGELEMPRDKLKDDLTSKGASLRIEELLKIRDSRR